MTKERNLPQINIIGRRSLRSSRLTRKNPRAMGNNPRALGINPRALKAEVEINEQGQ